MLGPVLKGDGPSDVPNGFGCCCPSANGDGIGGSTSRTVATRTLQHLGLGLCSPLPRLFLGRGGVGTRFGGVRLRLEGKRAVQAEGADSELWDAPRLREGLRDGRSLWLCAEAQHHMVHAKRYPQPIPIAPTPEHFTYFFSHNLSPNGCFFQQNLYLAF